jgi:hypothetical protein
VPRDRSRAIADFRRDNGVGAQALRGTILATLDRRYQEGENNFSKQDDGDDQVRRAASKPGSAIETRVCGPFRADAADVRALDAGEAAPTRRARRWALVLMAGSAVATIALFAGAWLLVRHLF